MPLSAESRYWFARYSKSIIFLIIMLAAVGAYEALVSPDRRFSPPQIFRASLLGLTMV